MMKHRVKALELGMLQRGSMTSQRDLSLCLHLPLETVMHWVYNTTGVGGGGQLFLLSPIRQNHLIANSQARKITHRFLTRRLTLHVVSILHVKYNDIT